MPPQSVCSGEEPWWPAFRDEFLSPSVAFTSSRHLLRTQLRAWMR